MIMKTKMKKKPQTRTRSANQTPIPPHSQLPTMKYNQQIKLQLQFLNCPTPRTTKIEHHHQNQSRNPPYTLPTILSQIRIPLIPKNWITTTITTFYFSQMGPRDRQTRAWAWEWGISI